MGGEKEWEKREGEGTYPEEAGVVAPVPRAGVEHIRRENIVDNPDNVIQVPPQHHRLDLQPPRTQLPHQRVAHGPHAQLVAQRPHQHDASRGEGALVAVLLGDEPQEAEDEEHAAEEHEAVEVEGAAADAEGHEEPGAEDADHVDGVLAEGEGVGFVGGEAGLFEEVAGWDVSWGWYGMG